MWLLVAILLCIVLYLIFKYFKVPKIGSLSLVSGGVKTGKTTLAVYLALREYRKALRKWKIRCFFQKLMRKPLDEKPLLYSNIPLKTDFVLLDRDFLLRNKRFNYKSVILISEASLFADSQLIKNQEINEQLLLFNKLIGHETRGGKLIYDTQQIQDCHYSIKRSLSSYFYIHHINKFFPFFVIAYVKEYRYSEDNSVIGTEEQDIEDTLKKVFIPKIVWKKFDCYCYSILTDELTSNPDIQQGRFFKRSDLKAETIPSFRNFKDLKKTQNVISLHCPNCGAPIGINDKKCQYCGSEVKHEN